MCVGGGGKERESQVRVVRGGLGIWEGNVGRWVAIGLDGSGLLITFDFSCILISARLCLCNNWNNFGQKRYGLNR